MSDCYECTSRFASTLVDGVRERVSAGQLQRKKLVWLELTGCAGNIISLLDGNNPDFKYLASQMVQIVYDNSLTVKQGSKAMEQLFGVIGSEFILAVEGAVATKDNGIYNIIGTAQGQRVTAYHAIKRLGEAAAHVIAVGTCASDGGMSAARPNPAECVSVQTVLRRQVIKLPGCPCHPDWFLGTLAHILLFGPPKLDDMGRPTLFYGTTIHQRCPRRSYFDKGIFAEKLGEETCMFNLGCRGPVTRTDCPIRRWNERVNWPIGDNTPCIGCAQFGFPDKMEPFVSFNTTREARTP
jgi:hydrogenase small subunit